MKTALLTALSAFLALSSAHAAGVTVAPTAIAPTTLAPVPVRGVVISIDIPQKDFELREASGRVTRYSLAPKARIVPADRRTGMPGAASLEGIRVNDRCEVTAQTEDGIQVTTRVDCDLR